MTPEETGSALGLTTMDVFGLKLDAFHETAAALDVSREDADRLLHDEFTSHHRGTGAETLDDAIERAYDRLGAGSRFG